MRDSDWNAVLDVTTSSARAYLDSLADRDVYPDASPETIRAALDVPLTEDGSPPEEVVAELARDLEPFVTAHASGRFFGFVIGGLHPASYGAELLVSTWDQNAALYAAAPGVAIVEEVATRWLIELLGLPEGSSVGFVTGGQMANVTCLAAARDHVLREVGWDVESDGLPGAPPINVVTKTGRHSSVPRALRYLGLGERCAVEVGCDEQDRYLPNQLRTTLESLEGPTVVCAEAGNINTGAFDPLDEIADAADEHRGRGNPTWVHVDGAVGLLAATSAEHGHLTTGMSRLDSWSVDGHKLLNVAYDCGIAICRHAAAHRAAMSVQASYLPRIEGALRDEMDWNPELSRRARGVGVYAVLRSLGRNGVAAVVDRTVSLARRFAAELTASGHAEVLNDVVFNQALIRWLPPEGRDPDDFNDRVIAAIQTDGTAYVGGTSWRGRRLMRISVSDWATDDQDVDRTVAAMLRCVGQVAAAG